MHFICPANKVKEVGTFIGISSKYASNCIFICDSISIEDQFSIFYSWTSIFWEPVEVYVFILSIFLNVSERCKKVRNKVTSCKFDWCVEKCHVKLCWHTATEYFKWSFEFFFLRNNSDFDRISLFWRRASFIWKRLGKYLIVADREGFLKSRI